MEEGSLHVIVTYPYAFVVLQSSVHVQKLKTLTPLTGIQKAIEYEALRQAKINRSWW